MIQGVKIKTLATHSDDRGYFREILRDDDNYLEYFGQASVSLTKPGIIKAFHWHKYQDDLFYVIGGNAQVVLYDLRKNSKTFKQVMTFEMSDKEPKLLFIPKKVAHGYKVLGKNCLIMLYFMSRSYNPKKPDEQTIPFDDKKIGFNSQEYK